MKNDRKFDTLDSLLKTINDLSEFSDIVVDTASCRNSYGVTPLHIAATWGNISALSLLIQNGASPNVTDVEMCTPLHEAVEQGHLNAVKFLVENGASLSAKNEDGLTPHDLAKVLNEQAIANFFVGGIGTPIKF